MVSIQCCHCRGPGSIPGGGTEIRKKVLLQRGTEKRVITGGVYDLEEICCCFREGFHESTVSSCNFNTTDKSLTDIENKLTVSKGEMGGREKLGVWD